MGFIALIVALVLCGRSQDSLMSVSVRRAHVVFSATRLKGGGKPCPKTRETAALQRSKKRPIFKYIEKQESPNQQSGRNIPCICTIAISLWLCLCLQILAYGTVIKM